MKKKHKFSWSLIFLIGLLNNSLYAQQLYLTGQVVDAQSKELLTFATILVNQNQQLGGMTDIEGCFFLLFQSSR